VCIPFCWCPSGLLESLQKSFETLEAISKSLEEYLETKRVAFPR
jgi:dynein heavy chain